MAAPGGEPPAPQPPTAVTAAALFKLAGECAAAIGARAARLARSRPRNGCGAWLSRRSRCAADELEGLTRAARSHREKCAVLLGAALNSKLALEQARPSLRARPLDSALLPRAPLRPARADPAARAALCLRAARHAAPQPGGGPC